MRGPYRKYMYRPLRALTRPLIFYSRCAIYILQSNASYANFNRHNIHATAPAYRGTHVTCPRTAMPRAIGSGAIGTPLVPDGIKWACSPGGYRARRLPRKWTVRVPSIWNSLISLRTAEAHARCKAYGDHPRCPCAINARPASSRNRITRRFPMTERKFIVAAAAINKLINKSRY